MRRILEILIAGSFLAFLYFLPASSRVLSGLNEGVLLAHWYAREHVIFCLIPAFFIAGAISVFVAKESVIRYLGPSAPKALAYGVAAVSGTVLAVCSCTVLPLFAGIYLNGAGLGPATAFLYSGPAINILAIVLTARILGLSLGLARGMGAIGASVLIGLLMAYFFRREEAGRVAAFEAGSSNPVRPLWQTALFIATQIAILVLATWGPGEGFFQKIYLYKWLLMAVGAGIVFFEIRVFLGVPWSGLLATAALVVLVSLIARGPELPFLTGTIGLSLTLFWAGGEARQWFEASYWLARQIFPLLFLGVFAAGFFLGRPGHEGFIPSQYVVHLVGGDCLLANFFASVVGALMYFATLTEVPILQGLLGSGMGKGPALALLLAGPAVSLPSMLVIRSVLGTKKTLAYLGIVIIISTFCGFLYGRL
ncbi:permease [Thermosulfuriphilus sp.]